MKTIREKAKDKIAASLRNVVNEVLKPAAGGPAPDPLKASELAVKLLGKVVPLPTQYNKENERVVAWHTAEPQIRHEARMLAAALAFLAAEEYTLSDDEDTVRAMGRAAALWWHGVTEDDIG